MMTNPLEKLKSQILPKSPRTKMKIMNKKSLSLAAFSLALIPSLGLAQTTYTWNGSATDGDWNNTANWDPILDEEGIPVLDGLGAPVSPIPVDDAAGGGRNNGLTIGSEDFIILNGANMPTLNIPELGGDTSGSTAESTPTFIVNSGGTLDLTLNPRTGNGWWTNPEGFGRDVLTVGDDTGPAGEVTVSIANASSEILLSRHPGSVTIGFVINSDGILEFPQGVNFSLDADEGPNRFATITINGGMINIAGGIIDLVTSSANFVTFTEPGGSFTANIALGSDFASFADVQNAIGSSYLAAPGVALNAVDNGDGSFTVTSVAANDPNYWTGTNGQIWDPSTTANFTTNVANDPLVIDTFANAVNISETATFADIFFNAGSSVAVTEFNVNIANGGVQTGLIDFLNENNNYSITSPDTEGITGTTNLRLAGSGEVTLLGTHAYTGVTTVSAGTILNVGNGSTDGSISNSTSIANEGSLIFNTSTSSSTLAANITGSGPIFKRGPETLTVTGAPDLTGTSTVEEGTLIYEDVARSFIYDVAAGATLDFSINNGGGQQILGGEPTFVGAGTFLITGDADIRWGASATFAFSSGALIDVQNGFLRGGLATPEIWVDNFSDLNVAADASFAGSTSAIRIDSLTGDGLVIAGASFTIGVDNGSGTFNGVLGNDGVGSYTKVGTGTQTLTGLNTYTGNTLIETGELILTETSSLAFVPTADTITNQISGPDAGTGSVTLGGQLNINLTDTITTAGNTWQLVDDTNLSVTYGPSFAVTSSLGAFTESPDGVWTLSSGVNAWTFEESTGILTVSSALSGFEEWISGFPLLSDFTPNGDPDGDGLVNLIEFVVNGDPGENNSGLLPSSFEVTDTSFIFVFDRMAGTETSTTQIFQYSSSLEPDEWINLNITDPTAAEIVIGAVAGETQTITVTLPVSLAVNGRLFGRLLVE